MIGSRSARLGLSAAAALVLPIGGAVAFSAGSAGAVTTSTITCNKLSGNAATTVKLAKCNGNTGTKSKALSVTTLAEGGVVNWKNGRTTTFKAPKLTTGTNCPSGDTDEVFKGKVSADTTGSARPIPGKYKGEVCIDGSGNISLAPGSTFTVN
jgi:hypothetical protein